MTRSLIVLAAVLGSLTSCKGFKEAMTAHVNVAATAGSQELSVDHLTALLGKVKAQPSPDVARSLTNLWVYYQLLGVAAAKDDSLANSPRVDSALWPFLQQARAQKWHEEMMRLHPLTDTTATAAQYAAGKTLLAAQHILLTVPHGSSAHVRDSIRRRAEALRRQVTSANFSAMATKYSQDPGSAARGGSLGVFPPGTMIPQFQQALLALKPGQISPVVSTQFGYHIIRRPTFAEVRAAYTHALVATAQQASDSTYLAQLEANGKIDIRPKAVAAVRAAAADVSGHAKDQTVIATSRAGKFTVARLVRWVEAYPQRQALEVSLQHAPDSQVVAFTRNLLRNELVLHQADSAHIELDTADVRAFHQRFAQIVTQAWDDLGVSPAVLRDSAKSEAKRERIAAAHVDDYLDRMLANQAQYVPVGTPLEEVARATFGWKVNQSAVARAAAKAGSLRAAKDSAAAKNAPPTAVPIGPGAGAPASAPAAPAPAKSATPASPPSATSTAKPNGR